jgi:hypothetical protein
MPKKKISKDWKHPELKRGEVFLTNSSNGLKTSSWKTKRVGKVAYNIFGEVVKGYSPVFVKKQELKKAKIEIKGKYNVD